MKTETLEQLRDRLAAVWPDSDIKITETWTHAASRHQGLGVTEICGAVHVMRDGVVVPPSPCRLEYFAKEVGG